MMKRFNGVGFLLILLANLVASCSFAELSTEADLIGEENSAALAQQRILAFHDSLEIIIKDRTMFSSCHREDGIIPLKLIFKNLSRTMIVLYAKLVQANFFAGRDSTSYYTISMSLAEANGKRVIKRSPNYAGYMPIEIEGKIKEADFVRIPPNSEFAANVDLYIPNISDHNNRTDLPSAQLVVKIYYKNYLVFGPSDPSIARSQRDWKAWMGAIESNWLDVCIAFQ